MSYTNYNYKVYNKSYYESFEPLNLYLEPSKLYFKKYYKYPIDIYNLEKINNPYNTFNSYYDQYYLYLEKNNDSYQTINSNYNSKSNIKLNNKNNLQKKTFVEKAVQTDDISEYDRLIVSSKHESELKLEQKLSIEKNNSKLNDLDNLDDLDDLDDLDNLKNVEDKFNKMSKDLYELDILCDFNNEEESRIKQEYLEIKEPL
jgi:hypothetical protein